MTIRNLSGPHSLVKLPAGLYAWLLTNSHVYMNGSMCFLCVNLAFCCQEELPAGPDITMYVYVVVGEERKTRTLPLTYKNTVEQHIACFAVIGYSE